MRTLTRAVKDRGAIGTRLHLPWRNLDKVIRLHTKELAVLAGAPGGGKTMLALNMAMNVEYPVLYFAQDSPASALVRMASIALGVSHNEAHARISKDRDGLAEALTDARPTLMFERGAVTLDRIRASVEALAEWLGEPPPLVFIDNLIDMIVEGYTSSEAGFYATVLPQLKQMANELNTSVVALHHVIRSGESRKEGQGRSGIKMSDLLFAGEREARHVWGVYNDGADTLSVQVLKQQDGPADPQGGMVEHLRWYPKLNRIVMLGEQ